MGLHHRMPEGRQPAMRGRVTRQGQIDQGETVYKQHEKLDWRCLLGTAMIRSVNSVTTSHYKRPSWLLLIRMVGQCGTFVENVISDQPEASDFQPEPGDKYK